MAKKELDVKVVSKEEAYWTNIIDKTQAEVKTLTEMLKFNHFILRYAKQELELSVKQEIPQPEPDESE
jgi:hypothetical protein